MIDLLLYFLTISCCVATLCLLVHGTVVRKSLYRPSKFFKQAHVNELRDINCHVLPATRHRWTRFVYPQPEKLVLDLPILEGWKAELTYERWAEHPFLTLSPRRQSNSVRPAETPSMSITNF